MVQVVQNAKVYGARGARYRLLREAARATARAAAATVFVSEALRAVAEPILRPRRGVVIRHGISAPKPGPPATSTMPLSSSVAVTVRLLPGAGDADECCRIENTWVFIASGVTSVNGG